MSAGGHICDVISGYQKNLTAAKQEAADLAEEKTAWTQKEQDLNSKIAKLNEQ